MYDNSGDMKTLGLIIEYVKILENNFNEQFVF
jgi:hypothetical protein